MTAIRHATSNDLDAILEIMNDAIVHTTSLYDYQPRNYQYVRDWFNDKHKNELPVIVAVDGGQTVGFASYGPFRLRDAYRFSVEHSIYMARHYRGKGTGSLLMNELIALAQKQKLHTMIAGVDAANKGSYDFHIKHGFTEVGRINEVGYKFDRWLDLIFMQRML